MKIAPTGNTPSPSLVHAGEAEHVPHGPQPSVIALAHAAEAAPASREHVEQAVDRANRQMAAVAPSLQFEVDPDTRDVIIRLVDRQDQHVLRQVPAPEMLAIARALDRMQALLLRARA